MTQANTHLQTFRHDTVFKEEISKVSDFKSMF